MSWGLPGENVALVVGPDKLVWIELWGVTREGFDVRPGMPGKEDASGVPVGLGGYPEVRTDLRTAASARRLWLGWDLSSLR
jgi:hypothetical protein